jgi:transposase
LAALDKALRRLISRGARLHVVYEAGPCGFVIWRHLTAARIACDVVAPSSIPRARGERIKTDRRDAMLLARQARPGDLKAVWVPDAGDEDVRDLVRAREDALGKQRNARHRLKALLLRSGIPYAGKSAWTKQGGGRRGARACRVHLGHRSRGADFGLAGHQGRVGERNARLTNRALPNPI